MAAAEAKSLAVQPFIKQLSEASNFVGGAVLSSTGQMIEV